jgi:hypothetical protein
MLQVTPQPSVVKDINGRRLQRRLRKGLSPVHRALLAIELESGGACLHHLSRRQAKRLTGANQRHVTSLRQASAEQREQVKRGQLALSSLPNKPPSDASLDRLVVKAGADRVMAALDRYTRPQFAFAAE